MGSFDLDLFIRNNPKALSSTQFESYLTTRGTPNAPKWLEELGIDPCRALNEGEFKNYLYQKAASPVRRLEMPSRTSEGPALPSRTLWARGATNGTPPNEVGSKGGSTGTATNQSASVNIPNELSVRVEKQIKVRI